MTSKYSLGEEVWVPSSRLAGSPAFALTLKVVQGQVGRSVVVEDFDGTKVKISSRLVHPKALGFLVVRLGDMATEPTLLDPLAKSVLQYLRLLMPDDYIRSLAVRTAQEIERFMVMDGAAYSHIILVGHGSPTSLLLMGGGSLPVRDFARILRAGGSGKTVISLACSTGKTRFGRHMSADPLCKEYVGPHSSVHGASASLFLQYLLHSHLLHGHEFRTAVRRATVATEGALFNHWRDGLKI